MLENIEVIMEKTKHIFFESDCSHPPLFMLNTDEGVGFMPCFWRNPDDKKKTSDLIKDLIGKGKLEEFIFIAEAWVTVCDNLKEFREGKKERKEILMVQYQSFGKNIMFCADILRNGDEVTLGEWVKHEDQGKQSEVNYGLFDNLFVRGQAANN